jgi:hypothetical protein
LIKEIDDPSQVGGLRAEQCGRKSEFCMHGSMDLRCFTAAGRELR